MVKKYKRKPFEIEAIQWNGKNEKEVLEFIKIYYYVSFDGDLVLVSLDGKETTVTIGDYITKDKNGVYEAYKPEEFTKKYELIVTRWNTTQQN